MARRIGVELLGSRVAIAVPDEAWERFVTAMWGPAAVEAPAGDPLVEVFADPVWRWRAEAGGELLGKGLDPWFLAGELRYRVVSEAILQSKLHLLHASMLSRDGRAVLLLAASRRGKTTLSLDLAARGWVHHGDDLAAIDPATLEVTGISTPAGIRDPARWDELSSLWGGAELSAPTSEFVLPARAVPSEARAPVPVGALAFIEFAIGAAPVLERITAAEAMLLCAEHSTHRDRAAVATYSALCRAVARGRLRYGSSDDALALLEDLLSDEGTAGSAKGSEPDTQA